MNTKNLLHTCNVRSSWATTPADTITFGRKIYMLKLINFVTSLKITFLFVFELVQASKEAHQTTWNRSAGHTGMYGSPPIASKSSWCTRYFIPAIQHELWATWILQCVPLSYSTPCCRTANLGHFYQDATNYLSWMLAHKPLLGLLFLWIVVMAELERFASWGLTCWPCQPQISFPCKLFSQGNPFDRNTRLRSPVFQFLLNP